VRSSSAVVVAVVAGALLTCGPLFAQDGGTLFQARCASCHAGNDTRIPSVESIRQRSPESIIEALTTGPMRQQGEPLTVAERRAIAEFLAGRAVGVSAAPPAGGQCAAAQPLDPSAAVAWGGWGPDTTNTRHQPKPGLSAEQLPKLKLKWAFGFPAASTARAQPTAAGGRLFVGGQGGFVYALDAKSGCTVWSYQAHGTVRTAVSLSRPSASGPLIAYFGDSRAYVYALDASTGKELWSKQIETHASAHVTGAPAIYQNRVYFPVASGEEGQGNNAKYECCTFRGSIVALDATSGALAWKTYTIGKEPAPVGKNRSGTTRWGPSGAGIWDSPTVDPKRRLLYAATGNMYTEPQQTTSDALVAFNLDTGSIVWTAQVTPKDVFVVGCNPQNAANTANCPDDFGPDFDFGNSPMLVTTSAGRDLIVIGQKSGVGWALDPDKKGAVVWQYRAGDGSALGGMEFGSTADRDNAYFPVADGNGPHAGEIHAVSLTTGERTWMSPPQPVTCGQRGRGCTPAILAAATSIPGAVIVGANDGGVRAYSTRDGALLWEFDTNREFTTVNGVAARGASISGAGATVADGMVFINSGYGALGGRPGNVLLAFAVE
jgi:polyvinyl alcohol dehydrogenase (cytochrome)